MPDQTLAALAELGMRTRVSPGALLDAARELDGVRVPEEAHAQRARLLLLTLDRVATQGAALFVMAAALFAHVYLIPPWQCPLSY